MELNKNIQKGVKNHLLNTSTNCYLNTFIMSTFKDSLQLRYNHIYFGKSYTFACQLSILIAKF